MTTILPAGAPRTARREGPRVYNHASIRRGGRAVTRTLTKQLVRVGHTPDPDDAFMCYGLASGRIPTGDYTIEQVLKDIESLNRLALQGEIEVTAVSIHAFAHLADRYLLLPCGAS